MTTLACEKCGGAVWDNTLTKRNPKQPDLKCKNQQGCGWVKWLKDSEKAALQGATAATKNGAPARPPVVLDKLMAACLDAAVGCAKHLPEGATADHDIILRIAQSLFIARQDNKGILETEKKALAELAAKAAEEKRLAEERAAEEARRRSALPHSYDDEVPIGFPPTDDSLPF